MSPASVSFETSNNTQRRPFGKRYNATVSNPDTDHTLPPCGLLRRLAAIFYDCLLLFAVLFAATALLMPFTHGEAIASENPLFFIYLLGWAFLLFGWQWTHGGQTLGMRAWKVKLIGADGGPVSWRVAGLRFSLALLAWLPAGAGFLWALVDGDHLTLHDRYSNTRLVRVPKVQ